MKPENSYSYFAGAVWTPGASDPEHSWWGWANGFSAYVDWFQIHIRNLVGQLQAQTLIDLGGFAPPGSVIRNSSGQLTTVNATFQNLGRSTNEGFDFGCSYITKEYAWGKLDIEANATYYAHNTLKEVIPRANGNPPAFEVVDVTSLYGTPDFKSVASVFYSKTVFGMDNFRTGLTLNYWDSEHDINDNNFGTNALSSLDPGGRVHEIGSWTTLDWQVSYRFGAPAEVVPETPKPGYDKEGKRIIGEKAVAPKPEGSNWGWRTLLANTTFTFGINNVFNAAPPFSADWYQGWDTGNTNPLGRFYYMQFEKKF